MKCFLGISNFLKRSLIFPLYCFPLFLFIDHWGRLSYLSLQFCRTLHSNGHIFFSPLLFASLLFTAICKASSDHLQFSRSVVSNSLRPHELQHARPPCPSPTPQVHSDSCPSSQWCHPAISSSVIPFSSCLRSLPASESFSNGQSTGVSALASFLPKKSQGWCPSEWTGWISL